MLGITGANGQRYAMLEESSVVEHNYVKLKLQSEQRARERSGERMAGLSACVVTSSPRHATLSRRVLHLLGCCY